MDHLCKGCKKNPIPDGVCCISDQFREYPLLKMAIRYAAAKHEGQKRKNARGDDYIIHPVEVMLILFSHGVTDESILIAAVMHDTVEDTSATLEEVASMFGPEVASVVDEVSDDKSLPKIERKRLQLERIGHKSLSARLVKIADKISNTRDLLTDPPVGWSDVQKHGYIAWAYAIYSSAASTGDVPFALKTYAELHFKNLGADRAWLEPYFDDLKGR